MLYGNTTLATDFQPHDWRIKAMKLVFFFIPLSNPDNEKLYALVKKWCLEIDEDGIATREIGIDASGRPIFAAPYQRNHGFWPDTDKTFDKSELELITAEQFEILWQEARDIKIKKG
jgi:hypothetical protein